MADQPKPLWQAMYEAAAKASDGWCDADGVDGGAMIRALADWLVPEFTEPPWPADQSDWAWHDCKQDIRQLLLAEADRAERGE